MILNAIVFSPLVSLLGYLYPAYMTYKLVERRSAEPDEFRLVCMYWILIASLTSLEGTFFFGLLTWLPFYNLLKLVFLVYLWHPRTQGAVFIYDRVLHPFVARYENTIDVNLHEIQTRGTDLAMEYSKSFLAKIIEIAQKGAQAAPRAYQNFYATPSTSKSD